MRKNFEQPEISSWRISGFCEICEKQKMVLFSMITLWGTKYNSGIEKKEIGAHFKMLEKSSNLGGTWFDIVYLGAACDLASHLYSLR